MPRVKTTSISRWNCSLYSQLQKDHTLSFIADKEEAIQETVATRNSRKKQKEFQLQRYVLSSPRCEPIQEIVEAKIHEITGKKWQYWIIKQKKYLEL